MSRSRTPERIAEMALALFNEHGEPNITTNRIADELDISPGNLHYHFRTKQALIDDLFGRFEQRMFALLHAGAPERADIEDVWLYLHLVFETIAEYRFVYRDLNELSSRSRDLARRIRAILKLSMQTADDLLAALQRGKELAIDADNRAALVRNIVLVSSYWIAFEQVLTPKRVPDPGTAAWQVMSLVSPYLRGDAGEQFRRLADAYRA
ncbi:MAG: TetR/AcrR family transcriptional regulator [Wenzhouxiangellaceae bacterium]|nr:TetR/AcrR family transcriptional regulator [Wenzhouxiangellaceae bacterium]